jgi:rod shape-determining protein MreD
MTVYALGLPLLLLSSLIDSSLLSHLRLWEAQPSLTLVMVVSWTLSVDLRNAYIWAILGGLCIDVLSVAPLGASSLGLCVAVAVLERIFGRVGRRNLLFPPLAAGLATALYLATLAPLLLLWGWGLNPLAALWRWLLPSMLMNALLILPVFRVVARGVALFTRQDSPTRV